MCEHAWLRWRNHQSHGWSPGRAGFQQRHASVFVRQTYDCCACNKVNAQGNALHKDYKSACLLCPSAVFRMEPTAAAAYGRPTLDRAPMMLIIVSGRPMDNSTASAAGQPKARQQYDQATRRKRSLRRTLPMRRALAAASDRSAGAFLPASLRVRRRRIDSMSSTINGTV